MSFGKFDMCGNLTNILPKHVLRAQGSENHLDVWPRGSMQGVSPK